MFKELEQTELSIKQINSDYRKKMIRQSVESVKNRFVYCFSPKYAESRKNNTKQFLQDVFYGIEPKSK